MPWPEVSRINTQKVTVTQGRIVVEGETDGYRHPFSQRRELPTGGMVVDPRAERLRVASAGDTLLLLARAPHPEAIKFIDVDGLVYPEVDNFTVQDREIVWLNRQVLLRPTSRIHFWSVGSEGMGLCARLDKVVALQNNQDVLRLSGIARGGVGEVVLEGRTYFAGLSFDLRGDRLVWKDLGRPLREGDKLYVLFYLQQNAAAMFRYQRLGRIEESGMTTFPLEIAPSAPASTRMYLNGRIHHANPQGDFDVSGRQAMWRGAPFAAAEIGSAVRFVLPRAAVVTQDLAAAGNASSTTSSNPVVTVDGQTVIPIPNPPTVLSKSILLAAGLVYVQGYGYTIDSGNLLWQNSPVLKTTDRLRLIGFNDQSVADATVIDVLTVSGGMPSPLSKIPSDPTKAIAFVSSAGSHGGLALFAGGVFSIEGRSVLWDNEALPLKDTDELVVMYYDNLSVADATICNRLVLTAKDAAANNYDIGAVPREAQRSIWTLNGEIMRWGVDYTISGSRLWCIGSDFQLTEGDEVGLLTR